MRPFQLLFVFVAASLQRLPATVVCEHHLPVPGLFTFGDSLADVGNNLYLTNSTAIANFPPYGETFFHRPTGRFSNGRLIIDFLTQKLGLPLTQPFLQPNASFEHGANFASAGSGYLNSTHAASNVVPFSTQISQYQELWARLPGLLGPAHAHRLISEAIYSVVMGGNDIGTYVKNSTTPTAFIELLLEEAQKGLLALYKAGGRKFILFETGPLGCTPSTRLLELNISGGACYEPFNQLIVAFNAGLKSLASSLTANLKGATFVYAKTYDFILDMIENGEEKYGFANTTFSCCGAGPFNTAVSCGRPIPENLAYKEFLCPDFSEYVFWDGTHPTQKTYRLLFDRLWHGNMSAIEPMNIRSLAKLSSSTL